MADLLKGKSVCVTGGTGFIGSHLCHRLIEEGASVFVLARDNSSIGLISDIQDRIRFYRSDITDSGSLQKIINEIKPDLIFHIAARTSGSSDIEIVNSLIDINLVGTVNMLQASINVKNLERFVFLSTSDVYGNTEPPFSENSTIAPISNYGASKAAAELFCRHILEQHKIPWVILRPFIVYGRGQSPKMFIPQLIRSAMERKDFQMTGGKQTRDFLYVDDFVDACIKAGLNKEVVGEVLNIASGKETSLAKVAEKVMSLLDDPVKILLGALPYRDNERWSIRADISKANRLLNWKPKTDLAEGLKITIQGYNN